MMQTQNRHPAAPKSMLGRGFNPADLLGRKGRILAIALGFFAILLLYTPILGLLLLSFSTQPLAGIPWPLTTEWYHALTIGEGARWMGPMVTSLILAVSVSIGATLIALLIGRAVPRLKHRFGLLFVFISAVVLPGILIGFSFLLFYRGIFGIRAGFWSVYLAHLVWALPFALLCVLIVAFRFDHRLLEAGKDLGASAYRRFIDIELPLMMPGVSASLFFSFLLSFNELPRTLYARGSVVTLPYYLWTSAASHSSQVALVYALSAVITLASFVLTLIAMRILTRAERK